MHSPTERRDKNFSDSEAEEEKGAGQEDEQANSERQDLFCLFTNERELRNIE